MLTVDVFSLCAKMTSWFNYWGHMCLIFELLGDDDDDDVDLGDYGDDQNNDDIYDDNLTSTYSLLGN